MAIFRNAAQVQSNYDRGKSFIIPGDFFNFLEQSFEEAKLACVQYDPVETLISPRCAIITSIKSHIFIITILSRCSRDLIVFSSPPFLE